MRLNWVNYDFSPYDGYGRFSRHFVRALNRHGVDVTPVLRQQLALSGWLNRMASLRLDGITVQCTPPYGLLPVAGRLWLYSMTEGSDLPHGWLDYIEDCNVERVIVPCEHNAEAFARGGVTVPIHVVPGGTDPAEFPLLPRKPRKPYTFLCLADRGGRKGWMEVWQAFYKVFGKPEDTPNVRLLVKGRASLDNDMLRIIAGASNPDPRVTFWLDDVESPADVYAMADCFVIPSRSEGWGMPHREAAMMGLPVITCRHSGLDDGHTDEWAIVVEKTTTERIPGGHDHILGTWQRVDVDRLAQEIRWCYEHPTDAKEYGTAARAWLSANQTWDHAAKAFLALLERYG